jgi:hypothetical protein
MATSGFRYGLQPVLAQFAEGESAARLRLFAVRALLERELGVVRGLAELERQRLRSEPPGRACFDRVESARLKLDQAKADLELAMGQRARLERHRARRLDAYRAEQARCEEAELDEGNALLPGSAAVSYEVSST